VAGADVTHLDQARACLTGLAGRDDLPEAALAAVVADLRRNAHGPSPVPLTVARLQVLTDPLANTPGRLLVLAEGYYHLACDAAGPAPGYWQAVGDLAREFLATPAAQTHAADRAEALLLLELAALVQGLEVPAVGVGPPPPVRLAVWLDGLRRAALHLRTVWPAAGHPPGVAAALARTPAPLVLRPADARLIHFLAAQAERTPAARELGAGLPGWAAWQFPALGLARARQARWDGRTAEAQAEYAQVFEYADQNGRDDLLQVCVAERTS
jgi:hypothetical protein